MFKYLEIFTFGGSLVYSKVGFVYPFNQFVFVIIYFSFYKDVSP